MTKPERPAQSPQEYMISRVARGLGPDLSQGVAYVGGCATALLVTDPLIRAKARFTDDVDLIVHVMGYGQWHQLEIQLAQRGFVSSPIDDDIICRKRLRDDLGEILVDFMPDDHDILGFSTRWYTEALRTSEEFLLSDGTVVKLVRAPYFLATKLAAYKGRGNQDPMGSRDVEDILNLVEGRPTLLDELRSSSQELRDDITLQLSGLMRNQDFDYAISNATGGVKAREDLMYQVLHDILATGAQ